MHTIPMLAVLPKPTGEIPPANAWHGVAVVADGRNRIGDGHWWARWGVRRLSWRAGCGGVDLEMVGVKRKDQRGALLWKSPVNDLVNTTAMFWVVHPPSSSWMRCCARCFSNLGKYNRAFICCLFGRVAAYCMYAMSRFAKCPGCCRRVCECILRCTLRRTPYMVQNAELPEECVEVRSLERSVVRCLFSLLSFGDRCVPCAQPVLVAFQKNVHTIYVCETRVKFGFSFRLTLVSVSRALISFSASV